MKKVLLMAFVAGLAMTSCKKDYTCECVTSSNDPDEPSTKTTLTFKDKKKKAESSCNSLDRTYTETDPITKETYNFTYDCSIK